MTVWMVIQVSAENVVILVCKARPVGKVHRVHQENLGQLVLLAVSTTQMNQEPHSNVAGFKAALQYKIANNDV
jgi:hypothetical protein